MATSFSRHNTIMRFAAAAVLLALGACTGTPDVPLATTAPPTATPLYQIGPGDTLKVFVWRNLDLSDTVPVRPDGRVSIPLLEDIVAVNKTPTELAREIERRLVKFIQDPLVTVIVTQFVGPFTQQVRVVGEAAEPKAIPYRANMTTLDVMIEVGGLTKFAAGNNATIVRASNGKQEQFRVRLDDLIRDGDISANVALYPGDILIIPESFF